MKATEREAEVAVVAVRRVDIGAIEEEVERAVCRVGVPRPVDAIAAGVVQGAIRIDIPATDKEQKEDGVRNIPIPVLPSIL